MSGLLRTVELKMAYGEIQLGHAHVASWSARGGLRIPPLCTEVNAVREHADLTVAGAAPRHARPLWLHAGRRGRRLRCSASVRRRRGARRPSVRDCNGMVRIGLRITLGRHRDSSGCREPLRTLLATTDNPELKRISERLVLSHFVFRSKLVFNKLPKEHAHSLSQMARQE